MKSLYLDQKVDRVIHVDGKRFLYFSGTSYLGIGQSPEYQDILMDSISRYGVNHGQSRINNVRLRVFDEFEAFFSENTGSESAAVVSSGFLAGVASWQCLFPDADVCWVAPDSHPAVVPSAYKNDVQLNFTQWIDACLQQARILSSRKVLIIGNSVNPLNSQVHNYEWVQGIAEKHEVTLLLDDSHAFGVIGSSIFGTYADHHYPSINLIVSGSLGKGLAMPAGIILGEKKVIDQIKSRSLFGGSSPGSPASLHAFLVTQEIYLNKRDYLKLICSKFRDRVDDSPEIKGGGFFPVFNYSSSWVQKFEEAGIITSSFPYPTPQDPTVNRIIISGFHDIGDIEFLHDTIRKLN